MVRLTKLQLGLAALLVTTGIVSSAQATVYGSQVRRHGGWYIEVEPFHAKAADSLLSTLPYAVTAVDVFRPTIEVLPTQDGGLNVISSTDRFHYFDPDYEWGFRLAVGYDYPSCTCCNYGFSLEYTQHDSDDHQRLRDFTDSDAEPALFPFGSFFDIDATDVRAHYDYDFWAVDLLGHKNTTVCKCIDVQIFAGARYVQLDQDYHAHFFVADDLFDEVLETGEPISDAFVNLHDEFDGAGPRVGFNVFYPVGCSFGLTTEVAGDLLFGCSRSRYNEHESESELVGITVFGQENDFHADLPNHAHIVPGLSGKIGLTYRATFCNCSSFGVEVGWRGTKYFNISDHSAFVQATNGTASYVKDAFYHDFDFSGPYITFSYHA